MTTKRKPKKQIVWNSKPALFDPMYAAVAAGRLKNYFALPNNKRRFEKEREYVEVACADCDVRDVKEVEDCLSAEIKTYVQKLKVSRQGFAALLRKHGIELLDPQKLVMVLTNQQRISAEARQWIREYKEQCRADDEAFFRDQDNQSGGILS